MNRKNNVSAAPNTPQKKFSTGAISATVWKNEGQSREGKPTTFNTITLQRRYMDKNEGIWKSTTSMRLNDLPKAALVLNKAYEYLVLREQDTSAPDVASDEDYIEEEIIM
jgi:hypothetical protein